MMRKDGALRNYTTQISAGQSKAEIEHLLAQAGVAAVNTLYDAERWPCGLSFLLEENRYDLPVNIAAVYSVLMQHYTRVRRGNRPTREHASDVAWRILRDWVDAQMALLATGMVASDQILLPYLVLPGGRPLYDVVVQRYLSPSSVIALPAAR